MHLITKIRLIALVIAAILFVSGLEAVRHPKLKVATTTARTTPGEQATSVPLELVTSKSSRVFGSLGIFTGTALAAFTIWPMVRTRSRLRV